MVCRHAISFIGIHENIYQKVNKYISFPMLYCRNFYVYHFPLQFSKQNYYQHDTNKRAGYGQIACPAKSCLVPAVPPRIDANKMIIDFNSLALFL